MQAEELLELELGPEATVAELRRALELRGIAAQRLVARGRLLEDGEALRGLGRVYVVPQAVEVRVRTLEGQELRVSTSRERKAVDFKRQVLQQLGLLEAQLVANGRLIGEGRLTLKADDLVVVVPPRASRLCRAWRFMSRVLRALRAMLMALLQVPGVLLSWLLQGWHDPWSLVRPRRETPSPGHVHRLGLNPQMIRYAPGQNPRGEDLTALLSQGLVGM